MLFSRLLVDLQALGLVFVGVLGLIGVLAALVTFVVPKPMPGAPPPRPRRLPLPVARAHILDRHGAR